MQSTFILKKEEKQTVRFIRILSYIFNFNFPDFYFPYENDTIDVLHFNISLLWKKISIV